MLPPIDWNKFFAKLNAIAHRWFRDEGYWKDSALNGLGVEAKDLVQQSVLELINTVENQEPKPKTEDDCFRLAYTILRHNFLDCLKRKAYQTSDRIEEVTLQHELKGDVENKFEKLRLLAIGNEKLEDFVEAIDLLRQEKPDFKREDIANILQCTANEVTKLQNKLRYRASIEADSKEQR